MGMCACVCVCVRVCACVVSEEGMGIGVCCVSVFACVFVCVCCEQGGYGHRCMCVLCLSVCVYLCVCCERGGYGAGRLISIGCIKLQVSFRRRATIHRALLRKMTSKYMSSCESSPPCSTHRFLYIYMDICICRYMIECTYIYI